MRDAALGVERQTLIRQTKRRSYDGLSSGSPVRDHLRGVVSTLDLRVAEDLVGTNVVPAVAGFKEVDIHMVLDFDQ